MINISNCKLPKIKINRLIFQVIVGLLQFIIFNGQSQNNIRVNQLPILDQLPSNSVYRVFQDKEGYMWFGTQDGLCRYDGYRMKIFRSDLNNPNLLSSNQISAISEDFNGNIWIATDEGLNLLDENSYKIIPHPDTSLRKKSIQTILTSSDSTIWVGYSNIIKRYNPDFTIRDTYINNPDDPNTIPNTIVNYIFEDSYKNIWLSFWGNGLYKHNRESNQFIKYPKIGDIDIPFKMFQDNKNNYWVGTWNDGLYLFTPNSTSKNIYKKIPMPSWKDNKTDKTFFSFIQDDNVEYIWSMSMSGLTTYKYDKSGDLIPVNTQELLKNTNNIFSEIIKDRDGSLWIGAFSEGVFKIDFDKPAISNFPIDVLNNKNNIAPSFTSLCVDNHKDIWVNQNRLGLFIYSPETKTIKYFTEFGKLKNIPELRKTNSINYLSSRNEIWITNDLNTKIVKIKKKGSDITSLKEIFLNSISENTGLINHIFEDNKSNIWIGTNNVLFIQPRGSENIFLINKKIGSINTITQDTNDNLWISSAKGIYKIAIPQIVTEDEISNLEIENIQSKLLSDHIQSITADLSENIWIGTKEGSLIAYNTTDKSFTNRTVNCGLKGEAILDIISDKYNNIWITTYKRIIEFNPKNNAYFVYSASDGVQINSHLKGSFCKTTDSKYIYIGGNRGYSRFIPSEKLNSPLAKVQTKITDIKIQNKSILSQNSEVKFDFKNNSLVLSPEDKNIEIYFSTLDYINAKKIKYAYKLDGVDNDWIYAKNDRQFAVYNQLKKGHYTFCIKATDAHNLWSNNITKLTIYRKPAYYETNTAYLFYFSLFTLGIFLLFKIILGRSKLKNEVKITQIEKSKSEEITQTKLKYFTNISHDLLTPLTIINCLIDDIETTVQKNMPEFGIIRSNIIRLKRLLQQILDYRKVEGGKMELRVAKADISSFINDICYNHFIPMFDKKNILFELNSTPQEISAYFDADKMDKILFNLLSNAFKYTPRDGKIIVELNLLIKDNTEFISIKVSDTGIGIQPEDIEHIFQRFYNNKTTDVSETNGIGLSLTKDLAELHHGKISVNSFPKKGSTFCVEIPIDKKSYTIEEIYQEAQSLDLNNIDDNPQEDPEISSKISNINILVVEDNVELLEIIQKRLLKSYNVLTAQNGLEAIELVKSTDIDIIISDVMMPEMDGLELCRTLKNNIETNHISIILLTAKNSIDDRIECYNAGANAYISKPFEINVLQARIQNFTLQKKQQQQDFKSNQEINISSLDYPSMDEQFLKNAILIIEKNLTETEFDINSFAGQLNLSKSTLYRKIKTITGLSPIEFIRNIKLKHASKMLKSGHISISEVAYSVGFSDPKYFASCFKAEFNITPSEFQKKQ
ncbi:two-component regulator propeller domain-containing protein [Labilibaculum manganireducens]|uniref:hybrid sensor histidine kinase/response regulator transcription factor n=1 Tax=Labilibaculum manganireducens TaxID=1940525 RepID=UPI0029F54E5F|nr:two-component regulator propeller domain-containing protein [Labilibaculum manganireducens]